MPCLSPHLGGELPHPLLNTYPLLATQHTLPSACLRSLCPGMGALFIFQWGWETVNHLMNKTENQRVIDVSESFQKNC